MVSTIIFLVSLGLTTVVWRVIYRGTAEVGQRDVGGPTRKQRKASQALLVEVRQAEQCLNMDMSWFTPDGRRLSGQLLHDWIIQAEAADSTHRLYHRSEDCLTCERKLNEPVGENMPGPFSGKRYGKNARHNSPKNVGEKSGKTVGEKRGKKTGKKSRQKTAGPVFEETGGRVRWDLPGDHREESGGLKSGGLVSAADWQRSVGRGTPEPPRNERPAFTRTRPPVQVPQYDYLNCPRPGCYTPQRHAAHLVRDNPMALCPPGGNVPLARPFGLDRVKGSRHDDGCRSRTDGFCECGAYLDDGQRRDGDLRRLDSGQMQEWGDGRWWDVDEPPPSVRDPVCTCGHDGLSAMFHLGRCPSRLGGLGGPPDEPHGFAPGWVEPCPNPRVHGEHEWTWAAAGQVRTRQWCDGVREVGDGDGESS